MRARISGDTRRTMYFNINGYEHFSIYLLITRDPNQREIFEGHLAVSGQILNSGSSEKLVRRTFIPAGSMLEFSIEKSDEEAPESFSGPMIETTSSIKTLKRIALTKANNLIADADLTDYQSVGFGIDIHSPSGIYDLSSVIDVRLGAVLHDASGHPASALLHFSQLQTDSIYSVALN